MPNTLQCIDGATRLIGEDGNITMSRGRVELCISGAWGGICDLLFDSRDAAVVCGNLGFINGGQSIANHLMSTHYAYFYSFMNITIIIIIISGIINWHS